MPSQLLDFATWATPRLAPFARMAIGCAVRRGLASSLRVRWHRTFRAADVAGRDAVDDDEDDDEDDGGDDGAGDGGAGGVGAGGGMAGDGVMEEG